MSVDNLSTGKIDLELKPEIELKLDDTEEDSAPKTRTIHLGDALSGYQGTKLSTVIEVLTVIIKVSSIVARQDQVDDETLQSIAPVVIDELVKIQSLSPEAGNKMKKTFSTNVDKLIIVAEEVSGKDIDGDGRVGVGIRRSLFCCSR